MSKRAPRRPPEPQTPADPPAPPTVGEPADQQAPPIDPLEPSVPPAPPEAARVEAGVEAAGTAPAPAGRAVDEEEPGETQGAAKKHRTEQHVPPPPERLVGAVEALLLAAGDVLTPERIRDLLGLPSVLPVREALEQVRARWVAAGLAVELQDVARGVRVVTRPEYADYVRRLSRASADDPRLSQGLLETLSIVAYRQPVARAEIERIRGVQAGEALRALLDRHLLKVVGRSEQPGRPLLYGTTTRFLTVFGLQDVKDLPSAKDLARL